MSKILIGPAFGLLLLVPVLLIAQDSTNQINQHKIEFISAKSGWNHYHSPLPSIVNGTKVSNWANGSWRGSSVQVPLIRINNKKLTRFSADVVLPYLRDCPAAYKKALQSRESSKKLKKARNIGILSIVGLPLAGFIASAQLSIAGNQGTTLPTILILGLPITSGVFYGSRITKFRKEYLMHAKNSIATYNKRCYNSILYSNAPVNDTIQSLSKSTVPNTQEVLQYKISENDPMGLRFLSLRPMYGDVDLPNTHGFTWKSGVSLHLHTSKIFATTKYAIALIDNSTGYTYKGQNQTEDNPKVNSADYQRAQEWGVMGGLEIMGRNIDNLTTVHLGRDLISGMGISEDMRVNMKERVSSSLRVGIEGYRSILTDPESYPNMFLFTSNQDINPFNGETWDYTLENENSNHMTMLRSTNLILGLSRRKIQNHKLDVLGGKFHGKKERMSDVTEFYADLIYAPRIKLGDILIRYEEDFRDFEFRVSPDTTPLRKIGWRIGMRIISPKGLGTQLELGQRPGPANYPEPGMDSMFYLNISIVQQFGAEF